MSKDEIIIEWQGRRFCLSEYATVEKDSKTGVLFLKVPYNYGLNSYARMTEVEEPRESTEALESRCRECQTRRSGEGYGDDVPPKSGFDDRCDECETARELRFRMGITQATASGEANGTVVDELCEALRGLLEIVCDDCKEWVGDSREECICCPRVKAAHSALRKAAGLAERSSAISTGARAGGNAPAARDDARAPREEAAE